MEGGEISLVPEAIASVGFGDDYGYAPETYEIFPRQEFVIGRVDVKKHLQVDDITLSNRHVRLRCVQFDEDVTWKVPPVIYVENLSRNGTYISRSIANRSASDCVHNGPLDRVEGSIPFLDGDRLYLNQSATIFLQLRMEVEPSSPAPGSLMQRELQIFKEEYDVTTQVIGSGGQGTVFVALHQQTKRPLACKVVPLNTTTILHSGMNITSFKPSTLSDSVAQPRQTKEANIYTSGNSIRTKMHRLETEYAILQDIVHPNIVTIERVYIFEELITGGDLLSFMECKAKRLGNAQSAVIIMQVLKAVEYLHERNIVHRDIKPDNILMTSWKEGTRVVLTDFGHAKRIGFHCNHNKPYRMFSAVGTVGYTAPEVHKQNTAIPAEAGYSKAVDLWSIGTITALLLTGNLIFAGDPNNNGWESRQAKLRAAAQCDLSAIDSKKGEWVFVNNRAKDFIKALLVLDEQRRLTAKQALSHIWFTCHHYGGELHDIYEASNASWTPRSKSGNIVRTIDTSDMQDSSYVSSSSSLHSALRSSFFGPDLILRNPVDEPYRSSTSDIPEIMQEQHKPFCERKAQELQYKLRSGFSKHSIGDMHKEFGLFASPQTSETPDTQLDAALEISESRQPSPEL